MQPPPPPPTSTDPKKVTVARDGVVLGTWAVRDIRPMIISGDLLPSDHVWAEGDAEWTRLVPEPPGLHVPFPFIGDDPPFYYIKDGFIYGPRTADEIGALVEAEMLVEADYITFLGAPQWWPTFDFLALAEDEPAAGSGSSSRGVLSSDHLATAIAFGVKVFRKLS